MGGGGRVGGAGVGLASIDLLVEDGQDQVEERREQEEYCSVYHGYISDPQKSFSLIWLPFMISETSNGL